MKDYFFIEQATNLADSKLSAEDIWEDRAVLRNRVYSAYQNTYIEDIQTLAALAIADCSAEGLVKPEIDEIVSFYFPKDER